MVAVNVLFFWFLLQWISWCFCSWCKRQKIMTVSMRTLAIPHFEVKVWTHKSELLQGNFLDFLTKPENTRQIPLKPNRNLVLSNKVWNYKDGICWIQHWYLNVFYEYWWYRRLWNFLVVLTCIFRPKKHN